MAKSEPSEAGVWINLIGHAVLVGTVFVTAIWIAPLFLRIVGLSGYFPEPLLLAMNIAYFSGRNGLLLIPVIALLLWLDAALFRLLLRRMGRAIAISWSALIALLLAGALISFLYMLTIPTSMMYRVRAKTKVEHLPFYYWPAETSTND